MTSAVVDDFELLRAGSIGLSESRHPQNSDTAIDLARRGFAVFPIFDWGDGDGWKPIKDFPSRASSEEDVVACWWRRYPDARVGLLADERNGFSVLDLDLKHGKDGTASLARLGFADLGQLSPVRVRTPSGGWHLYFRHDPRLKNSASKIGDGIDVKTRRAYVIAPGSLKDGQLYEPNGATLGSVDLPEFPSSLVPPEAPEQEAPTIVSEPSEDQREWADSVLGKQAVALSKAQEGGRNDRLNTAAMWAGGAAAHGFISREQAFETLWEAAAACGIRKREFTQTFKSGFNAGLKKPISGFPIGTSADEFDELEDRPALPRADNDDDWDGGTLDEPKRAPSAIRFLSPSECSDAPSRGYVIKGFIAPGDVGCIFGAPGAGKSLISPHLGYAVAQGRSAFAMRTRSGKVFYVAAEDPHGMRGRVSALKRRHGDAPEFVLVEGVSDLLTKGGADRKALVQAVIDQEPAIIFIDTLAMAFPGLEENSADAMGRVVDFARRLARNGAAVILIHHDTKAQGPTPRGHSLLNGALDMALQLFPQDENGIVRGKLTKNRNGSCDKDIAFRIDIEKMGADDDGDPVTIALVDELVGSAAPRQKLTPSERSALKILSDLIYMAGDTFVSEDAWRTACIDGRTVSASDNQDSRRKATDRALAGLGRKEVVTIRNGEARLRGAAAGSKVGGHDDLEPE